MQHKKSVDWLAIRHFWNLCAQHRRLFMLTWLTPLSGIGLGVAIPLLIGKIIGSLAQSDTDQTSMIIWLVIICIVTVTINYISFGALFKLQARVMAELETESLHSLMQHSVGFHSNRVSGKLVSDTTDYVSGFLQLHNSFFVDILPFMGVVVVGSTLVTIQSPLLGLILVAMTLGLIIWTMAFRRRMAPFRRQRQAAGKAVVAHAADTIVNNQNVKTFASEAFEMRQHAKLTNTLMGHRTRDWVIFGHDGAKRMAALFVFEIIFIIALVYEVHQNPALLATGIFAFSYTVMLGNRLFQIGMMMRQVEESLLLVEPMTEILQQDIEITDEPDAAHLTVTKGAVVFKAVDFRYHDNSSGDAVFTNLNIAIDGGEKIGLVGPSGGGKSTLTKLLLRFEDINGGEICIDGQNISQVTQESLRRAISYVSQEPLLFHRSIRDNIAYGNPEASKDEIHAAARKAYADDFIVKLPDGYDTVVGERGVKLSGGQRQRIAIARAILKNAPILLLDEATSALDSESEKYIQAALAELMKHKTTIVIAHRLSTIQKLDRIIVLNEGTITESGTHQELLDANGLYAKLWNHQSGGFIDE